MPNKPTTHRPPHTHQHGQGKAWDEQRGTVTERGYGHAWRKVRAAWLRSHPWCAECERQGLLTRATVLDHVRPKSMGGKDDDGNYQSMCESCHNTKRQRESMEAR